MAFPSLNDIRGRVRSILNESSSSTFLPDAVLNRFINEAEREIAAKTGCLESIDALTTSASSRLVPFSGLYVKDVEYIPGSGSRIGIQQITPKHLGSVQVSGTSVPEYWFRWGGNVVVEPLPGATTYTLYAYIADYPQTEMSESTDEPAIPASFYEDIIQYAAFLALVRDRKFQQAAFCYNRYIESIQAKKQLIVAQTPDTPMVKKIPTIVAQPQREAAQ